MRLGSMFAGIGGVDLGLIRSGLVTDVKWQVDNDEFCTKILKKNFPDSLVMHKNVEDINTKYLPEVDIITAGFPCQPVSVAGNQKGVLDERWLWDEVERFIDELRPQVFMLENVPNILRASNGEAIHRVLKSVAEMRHYRFEWQLISAKFVGARHKRQRWVGVGIVGDSEHYGSLASEIRGRFGESAVSWRSREEEQKKIYWQLARKSENLAHTDNNGSERGQSETRNETNAGENEESYRSPNTENIERSSMDGHDRKGSDLDGVLPGSRDSQETNASRSNGVRGLSEKSDISNQNTEVDQNKEINSGSLVQEGQVLQSSDSGSVDSDQTTPKGDQVRQGVNDSTGNGVENQRGDGNVADSLDTGQRTQEFGIKRQGQESSKDWGREQIPEPSRQSAGEEKGNIFDTSSLSSIKASQSPYPISESRETWLYFGTGHWGTRSHINWDAPQPSMGEQTYGLPRWLAEIGLTNDWGVDNNWEDGQSRVAERKENDVDRLKALGNGVVPQFSELVGRLIIRSLIEDTLVFDPEIVKVNRPQ